MEIIRIKRKTFFTNGNDPWKISILGSVHKIARHESSWFMSMKKVISDSCLRSCWITSQDLPSDQKQQENKIKYMKQLFSGMKQAAQTRGL